MTVGGKKPIAEYNIWAGMIQRCEDAHSPLYKDYGARGIKVCQRWRLSFQDFLADVGPRPGSGYTLERERNEDGYQPDNVRWATRKEQARNRRSSRRLTANGETLTLAEWCERLGCNHSSIIKRISRGMSEQEALTKPFKGK